MKPLRLVLENVHSFRGRHELDFAGINLAVLSGGNGNGKSTLACDAPLYALFGSARGDANSIISEGENLGRVEFAFQLGEESYLVSRSRTRRGGGSSLLSLQRLTENAPQVLDGKSIAETQDRINSLLHMDARLLEITAFSQQGQTAMFSEAKPAERKAVLSEILDLGAWERRAELARAKARDLDSDLARGRDRLTQLEGQAEQKASAETELAEINRQRTEISGQLEMAEGAVGDAERDKEALVQRQAEDQSRRKELTEIGVAGSRKQGELGAIVSKRDGLLFAVKEKPTLKTLLDVALGEQRLAEALETVRQKDERLGHEITLLTQRIESAKAQREQEKRTLEAEIRAADAAQASKETSLRGQITLHEKQAQRLGDVPCTGTPLADQCPLIVGARESAMLLPRLKADLAAQQAVPVAPEAKARLAELATAPATTEDTVNLAERQEQRRSLKYDAASHAKAKAGAAKVADLQSQLQNANVAAAQASELDSQIAGLETEIKELKERHRALSEQLGPAEDWARALQTATTKIADAKRQAANLQQALQGLERQVGAIEQRIEAATKAAEEAEKVRGELAKSEGRLRILKELVTAFGKSGIPALLMEQAIPDLEAVANDVLSTLSDGRMSVSLRSQRETKANTISETLDIVVLTDQGERSYDGFSGGERMRVDLALRFALSMLLASRAGARCELMVLDEAAAPLDQQGQQLFVECLTRLAERFATILVISHVEALKDAFPVCLQVTKNGDGSRVEVVAR